MKKWLLYVGSTILVLFIMVQMGWLQIIGINRISFASAGKDGVSQTDTLSFASEDGVAYRVKAEGEYFYLY